MKRALRGVLPLLWFATASAPVHADPLDELRAAIVPFRGIGYGDVRAYRVPFTLPDDDDDAVPLVELWRAPAVYGLRPAAAAPAAVVRSWAIFLEPLYVARASLLDGDLESGAARLRAVAALSAEPGAGGGRTVRMTLPATRDSLLPELLRDVSALDADLDAKGRLCGFRLVLRDASGRDADTLRLACTWTDARAPQPAACTWTLPDGGRVDVATTFRDEGARRVPGARTVSFPSRYDPGEREEIRIEYGPYELDPPELPLEAKGTFRFDANGLRSP